MNLTPKKITPNKQFIGRQFELERLNSIANSPESSIIIVHGRRRVGKTELIEYAFAQRNILKFEGIEGASQSEQRAHVLHELSKYAQNNLINQIKTNSWKAVFEILSEYLLKGTWTLYLEELQWLAGYKEELITHFKYIWDNALRHNPNLTVVLCGSSPSFMVQKVLQSKALYNRSQYEIALKPFTLEETKAYLKGYPLRDIMDAYLTVGGIPEYLKRLKQKNSPHVSLCEESFTRGGFFTTEHERIFISSLSNNPHYKKIVAFLSKRKYANRTEITKHLKTESGGGISDLLFDLESCGFITKYQPLNRSGRSNLTRYCIADNYLQFYFKFIEPLLTPIENGKFHTQPTQALPYDTYQKWLGFSFERACRKIEHIIAEKLGFSGVRYQTGAYYSRSTETQSPGFQIDLMFIRQDRVYTICECKYLQSPATPSIIAQFERILEHFKPQKNWLIQKILITTEGADDSLKNRRYFDKVLTLEDLFR